jgi:hypothetical protein
MQQGYIKFEVTAACLKSFKYFLCIAKAKGFAGKGMPGSGPFYLFAAFYLPRAGKWRL